MNNKPVMQKEVALDRAIKCEGVQSISFWGTPDAAKDFEQFGHLAEENGKYYLHLDGRYDFDEVVEYIKKYGE